MSVPSASMLSTAISVAFLLVILLTALFCGLARRRYKFVPALVLLAVTVVSAAAAAFICRMLVKPIGHTVFNLLSSEADAELTGWLGLMPTGAAGLEAVSGLFAAFLLFIPVFILVYILFRIIAGVLIRVIGGRRDGKKHTSGFLTGLANGAVLGIILLIPLCCIITTSAGAVMTFLDTGAGDTPTVRESLSASDAEQIKTYGTALSENGMVRFVDTVAGKPTASVIGSVTVEIPTDGNTSAETEAQLMAYGHSLPRGICKPSAASGLTKAPVLTGTADGGKPGTVRLDLSEDLEGFAEAAGYLVVAVDGLKAFNETHMLTEAQIDALDRALEAMLGSDWLAQTAAELLSAVATGWSEGTLDLDLPYPELNELLEPLMKAAIEVLSTETAENLRADMRTIVDVMYLLTDIPFDGQSYNTLMQKVWGEGLYDKLTAVIGNNEHLNVMNGAMQEFSFRAVSYAIGRDALENGQYRAMLEELAAELEKLLPLTSAERETAVRQAVQTAFEKYSIQVPDTLAVSLAEELLTSCGSDGNITPDELYDFLMSHYETVKEYVPAL